MTRITPSPFKSPVQGLAKRLAGLEIDLLLLKYAFPWAIEKAKEKYSAYHKLND